MLPLPVPASVYGLVLLLAALTAGVVKLEQVKETGTYLTGIFPLLFVPAAAGIMELWAEMGQLLLPILIAILPVTVLVIFGLLFVLYGNFKFPFITVLSVLLSAPVGAVPTQRAPHVHAITSRCSPFFLLCSGQNPSWATARSYRNNSKSMDARTSRIQRRLRLGGLGLAGHANR